MENTTAVTVNKSNEKCMSNINDQVKSDKKISQDINNIKSGVQLNHIGDDENTVEISDNFRREDSVIKCTFNPVKDKDLEITKADNVCMKKTPKENILEKDNLFIDNPAETNNPNAELTNDGEEVKLKETANKCDETDSAATCDSNNLSTSDDNDHVINSVKFKICNDEKLSATTSTTDKCDDNLTVLNDNVVEKVLKRPFTEIDNNHDSPNAIKSYNSDDSCSSFKYSNKCKTKTESLEHDDITPNASTPKTQSIQGMNTEIAEIQNNSSNIINKTEVTNENCDIKKSIKITDNVTLTKLAALEPINVKSNEESETDNIGTIPQRRKRLKKNENLDTNAVQDCIIEEDKQGRKHFIKI